MMPLHLTHLSHSLSHCTEQRRKAEKANDKPEADYWDKMHAIIRRACREIGDENYKRIK